MVIPSYILHCRALRHSSSISMQRRAGRSQRVAFSEQLAWLSTWIRSAVAHWLGMDTLHGNECVPVLQRRHGVQT